MQRTIESLQAEFVAMREEKADEEIVKPDSVSVLETLEAKRLKIGPVA